RRARSSKATISTSPRLIFSIAILLPQIVGTRLFFSRHPDDEDVVPFHIIEHSEFPDTQAVLGRSGFSKLLDASMARQGRVDCEQPLDLIQDCCAVVASYPFEAI